MTKLLYSVLLLLLVTLVHAQPDYSGEWKGTVLKDGKSWNAELHIFEKEKLKESYLNLPDYGLHHLQFDSISIESTQFYFRYRDRNSEAVLKGTFRKKAMDGGWTGLGVSATFALQRVEKKPYQFEIREVSFQNNDATLAATLVMPRGKGPFPTVVQVHGSGNQSRTETFYSSRAYLLAKNGIATLIYDRRGQGKSTGKEVSMELLADDAIAGVHFLQKQSIAIANKIGIMGFSQGGYIAPLAASRSRDIAFLIAGAVPGITPDEQNDFDVENALLSRGVTDDTVRSVLKFRKDLRDFQYMGQGDKDELSHRLSELKKRKWFRHILLTDASIEPSSEGVKSFLTFNPLPTWEKVLVPSLLIWGEQDNLVPAIKSRSAIAGALKKAGNNSVEMRIFPNAGHGLAQIKSTKEWDWPRLVEGYHPLIVSWLDQVVKKQAILQLTRVPASFRRDLLG